MSTQSDLCFVISGLPASGKSHLGRKLAACLQLPFLDKDDFLENLFLQHGTGDSIWRQRLSRKSDELFQQAALKEDSFILVSHWRNPGNNGTSGTPTQWINQAYSRIFEIYCDCPINLAARRFTTRKRHPGHLDHLKSRDQVTLWLEAYKYQLPLNIGKLIKIDTSAKLEAQNFQRLMTKIDAELS